MAEATQLKSSPTQMAVGPIGVPEVRNYNVTLDETTLPEGIAVLEGGATQEVEFGLTDRVAKNFFIGEGERNETSIFDQIVSRFIYGINFGLMLGLAAVGVSLVFGTTGLSNFSHGEMVTFGAVAALIFGVGLQLPLFIAIPIAVALSAGLGWSLDAGLWRTAQKEGAGHCPADDCLHWTLTDNALRHPVCYWWRNRTAAWF
jgi:branched-chain amino acid transport system permease protein